ncbi:hypothetical protein FOG18_04935 [Legionella israelensis]|uniref:hypothetical protein n=1 Tax=Legionella israelensis TaxID=454 RepID=UPI001180AF65|nr:hypothetical protein [Legionella israelensis]QDP71962.1 hypothetical protein FOG18_04935 [Legionella israelensis]
MKKRTILVIGPVSPQASDMAIAKNLMFLQDHYQLDYLDSLVIMNDECREAYYERWKSYLEDRLHCYDAFMGFSFGGVILQQSFALFESVKKSIILFSTPSFADASLHAKLGKVVSLCEKNQLDVALKALYQDVFLSTVHLSFDFTDLDRGVAAERLIFGLNRVLETDSRAILKKSPVEHLHLIGECSQLVNEKNVMTPKTGCLMSVPKAGMRVLQDNPGFCQRVILERLSRDLG